MDETLTKVLYEKLLIQYMFNDEIVRENVNGMYRKVTRDDIE